MKFLYTNRRALLIIAAIGNWIGSLIALISPAFFFSQFFQHPPDRYSTFPYLSLYHFMMWGFILIMGIGYWMCAVNTEKHRVVLLIGGLGKLLAAVFFVMLYAMQQGRWLMIGGGIWDGLFGILFLLLFFARPAAVQKN